MTTYVPGVLAEGVIAPVVALIDKPVDELYVPPVVPTLVTACAVVTELQNGPAYEMVADEPVVMVTVVVVENAAQPPAAVNE